MAHTIYLADNAGNADGTSDAIRGALPGGAPGHQRREPRDSAGPSRRSREWGAGEFVVLANDDMDVEPQFLERLVEPLRSDERVGMVAGLTLQPGAGEVIDAFGIEVDPTLIAFNRLRHRSPGHNPGRLLGPKRRRGGLPADGVGGRWRLRSALLRLRRGPRSRAAPTRGRLAGGGGARRARRAPRWGHDRGGLARSSAAIAVSPAGSSCAATASCAGGMRRARSSWRR